MVFFENIWKNRLCLFAGTARIPSRLPGNTVTTLLIVNVEGPWKRESNCGKVVQSSTVLKLMYGKIKCFCRVWEYVCVCECAVPVLRCACSLERIGAYTMRLIILTNVLKLLRSYNLKIQHFFHSPFYYFMTSEAWR